MDIETFKMLGLNRRFDMSRSINGHTVEEFASFLQPPGDERMTCGISSGGSGAIFADSLRWLWR